MKSIKQPDYDKLERKIKKCKKCEGLNIPEETMGVAGYGSLDAELMVVGQSLHSYNPSTPDRQIPFVGPVKHMDSGVLLYDILRTAGYSYKKKNLFVTNVVHCHPPNNRTSKSVEIYNCKDFLTQEIVIVKPRKILAIGSDAKKWFDLPNTGKLVEDIIIRDIIFISAVHPSYIRRIGSSKYENKYRDRLITQLRRKNE